MPTSANERGMGVRRFARDLPGGARHGARVVDVGPHPLGERRVLADQVEAGIERARVEQRIAPRPVGLGAPEEVGVELRHDQ